MTSYWSRTTTAGRSHHYRRVQGAATTWQRWTGVRWTRVSPPLGRDLEQDYHHQRLDPSEPPTQPTEARR